MSLRIITADDWAALKEVRLRALRDAPDAFGVTLAEAEANTEEAWRNRAAGPGPIVLAFRDGRPVAMGGLYAPEVPSEAFVWGMWVAPECRGQGLARLILGELLDWADRHGRAVALHVTEGNDAARRLYEQHSFVATGEWQPLRDGSTLRVEVMRRA